MMGGMREIQDYESFGSLLPGRNYSSGSYNYGFQGQIKDDEIHGATGTSYAFEYRMHDPRVGRFLSIDPLVAKYAYNSPYAFSENRVIDGVELEGREWRPIIAQGECVAPGSSGIASYRWEGYETAGYEYDGQAYPGLADVPIGYQQCATPILVAPLGTVAEAEAWSDTERSLYCVKEETHEPVIEVHDAVTIVINRQEQTTTHTPGTFEIRGRGVTGSTIEPIGPSTTTSGLSRSIPTGTYDVYKHWRTKHSGQYGLNVSLR